MCSAQIPTATKITAKTSPIASFFNIFNHFRPIFFLGVPAVLAPPRKAANAMTLSVRRIISRVSVRARIVLLAAIPVAGFLVNGIAYTAGEREVEHAFRTADRAADLAEVSREFRGTLIQMRVRTRDFAARSSQDLIQAFEATHASAVRTFGIIAAAVDQPTRQKFAPLKSQLDEIAAQFSELAKNQKILGFTESEGIRDGMTRSAAAVERIIHEDMSWMSEADAHKLLISLMTMRRYEAEYRLSRSTLMQTVFFDEFNKFKTLVDDVVGADVLKRQLADQVKTYSDTFAQWIELTDKVAPPIAIIEYNVKSMIPVADEIIGSAKIYTNAASAALSGSQQRTRAIITGVGLAAVLIGLGFSWLIGRSIARPLNGLADVMKRLADGDMSTRIPATHASDEIGAMARTVIVFRDNMIERDRLTSDQTMSAREKEQRSESVAGAIAAFRGSIEQALGNLRGTAQQLELSSTKLSSAADAVTAESRTAESRVSAASQNVTSAATTAKPRPASPARAASIVALSASRLVCPAIAWIRPITSPMRVAAPPSSFIVWAVRLASETARAATSVDFAARPAISPLEAASSSTEPAAEVTFCEAALTRVAAVRDSAVTASAVLLSLVEDISS